MELLLLLREAGVRSAGCAGIDEEEDVEPEDFDGGASVAVEAAAGMGFGLGMLQENGETELV